MINYLYDSSGNWIAFRDGINVFLPTGSWLGWLTDEDGKVADTEGHYLGTIVGDRLFHEIFPLMQSEPVHPGYPGRASVPDHPGYPGRFSVPNDMEDIGLLEHA